MRGLGHNWERFTITLTWLPAKKGCPAGRLVTSTIHIVFGWFVWEMDERKKIGQRSSKRQTKSLKNLAWLYIYYISYSVPLCTCEYVPYVRMLCLCWAERDFSCGQWKMNSSGIQKPRSIQHQSKNDLSISTRDRCGRALGLGLAVVVVVATYTHIWRT